MNLFRPLIIIEVLLVVVSCSTGNKMYKAYADWDTSNNQKINRSEFIDAYVAQGYFKRWGARASTIGIEDLLKEAFQSMDTDNDRKLDLIEFKSQIKLYYFGMFNGTFDHWDDDSNARLDESEFGKHARSTNLFKLWDTNGDNRITERDMAAGMFYICDLDSDSNVDEIELNTWKRNRKISSE